MKRWKAILLACLLCAAAACGGANNAANMVMMQDTTRNTMLLPPDTEPEYQMSPMVEQESYTADDGTVLAQCDYHLVTMDVSNLEELSADAAQRAQQVADNFNARMTARMNDAMSFGKELEDMARSAYESGYFDMLYSDNASASVELQGRIYCVRIDSGSFSGGAHPNSYTDSYLFDLELGQFIDPAQVADDPVTFQKGAAELLLEKAREQDEEIRSGYYPEYAEVISHWYDGTVLFDSEGMTVVYSPYELGPYAMGTVELKLSYDEIRDLLGPGGLERLGLAAENTSE